LFNKLESHELSRKGRPNYNDSLTSKALNTSARVGGHDTNPTNAVSFALEFAMSSLGAAFDEQYESIPDDEIVLLTRKFCALHKFYKERRRPLTSSLTATRGRSSTPRTSMTTPTGMTPTTRSTTRRRTASETTTRSFRISCPECMLP
jgi:hypothetical protein